MKNIKNYLFIFIVLFLLVITISSFYKTDIKSLASPDFKFFLERVYSIVTLLVFLLLILILNIKSSPSTKSLYSWFLSFGFILLIFVSMAYYINPHGRFPTQNFLAVFPTARRIKMSLYEKINYNPDIIIMGTSKAFTLSPKYIEQKTNRKVFNFSVEGGLVIDTFWQLNYILDQSTILPKVLIIDIPDPRLPTSMDNPEAERNALLPQPLSMVPYLSLQQQQIVILTHFEDVFSFQTFSDSLFLLNNPHLTADMQTWQFENDGYGVRKPMTPAEYQISMQHYFDLYERLGANNPYFCSKISESDQTWVKTLITKAAQNDIAIIYYQSPINESFLQEANLKNERYNQCQKILVDFMSQITSEYQNVQFVNLIEYKPITTLKEAGFYDMGHLLPNASDLVIDQLLPYIQSAIQWSENQVK